MDLLEGGPSIMRDFWLHSLRYARCAGLRERGREVPVPYNRRARPYAPKWDDRWKRWRRDGNVARLLLAEGVGDKQRMQFIRRVIGDLRLRTFNIDANSRVIFEISSETSFCFSFPRLVGETRA